MGPAVGTEKAVSMPTACHAIVTKALQQRNLTKVVVWKIG